MKRVVLTTILVLFVVVGGFAQLINLSPLSEDFESLFAGIGREVAPSLQQIALAGDIVGEAELGGFPHFSLTLPGIGVTLTSGIGKSMSDPTVDWKFFLAFPELINTALAAVPDAQQYYDLTKVIFPFPSVRLGLGFGLFGGLELLFNGFAIPQMLVDTVAGMVNIPAVSNATLDIMNVGARLRKVFLRDEGLAPAISAGIGYTYAHFNVGYQFSSLTDIIGGPLDLDVVTLDLGGNFLISTLIHSVGMDFHVSKRLFLLTPFLKISPWYHWTTFTTNLDLTATAAAADEAAAGAAQTVELAANPQVSLSDLSVYVTGGLEVKLLILVLSTSVTVNLENPIVSIPKLVSTPFLELDESVLHGVTANVGIRIQL